MYIAKDLNYILQYSILILLYKINKTQSNNIKKKKKNRQFLDLFVFD